MPHQPVLLQEVLESLDPQLGDFMIDGTMDGGGHATAIMKKISPNGRLLGVDWDKRMIDRWEKKMTDREKAIFVHANYAELPEILQRENLPKADGLLLDLGFSSEQMQSETRSEGRGFSFAEDRADEPLLMTYDDSQEPVREILRRIDEAELANIIYEFGGERFSRRIAKAIKERGRQKAIMTSGELVETVHGALRRNYEHGRIDSATRTFQALRIYANGELKNLKKVLDSLGDIVKPGGRIAIITFHSLEDRIVKHSFRAMVKEEKLVLINKKPIAATREEIEENPRSRSAKLRAAKIV